MIHKLFMNKNIFLCVEENLTKRINYTKKKLYVTSSTLKFVSFKYEYHFSPTQSSFQDIKRILITTPKREK